MTATKRAFNIILLFLGMLGMALFLTHMLGFKPHDYFFKANPDIEMYIGVNVVSMLADLSFFTYHTLVFFSAWLILFSLSELFNSKILNSFLRDAAVVSFVCTNFIITAVMYTVFELTSGDITFGLYANTPKAIYNLVTNLLVHYGFFILSLLVLIRTRVNVKNETRRYRLLCILAPTAYLLVYYAVVKITGLISYKIIWYPYPIFDSNAFAAMLALENIPHFAKTLLLICTLILLLLLYLALYRSLILLKKKSTQSKV